MKWNITILFYLITTSILLTDCAKEDSGQGPDGSSNYPPEIVFLEVNPDTTQTGGHVSAVVEAIDPDGDLLSYSWSSSGGMLRAEQTAANWTAPQDPGHYKISVIVRDDRKAEDNSSVSVWVVESEVNNQPPVISSMMADPLVVPAYGHSDIVVQAEDPDGDSKLLIYEWGADDGALEGEGTEVRWTSPHPGCCPRYYSVWVVVTDDNGATAAQSVSIMVIP
ncbi:MAG: hypothetical protein ACE5OP_13275 [Candidatus Glassbacteria bacterium]